VGDRGLAAQAICLGGGEAPFIGKTAGLSFVLAFRALPLALVVSALSALLFYWRILPLLVRTLSFLLEQALGIGGAVGLSAAANIFVGMVEAPLAWLIGIPWQEATIAGTLMGKKTVLNEFIAYLDLARLPKEALSPRSRLILTYALCGFANFGSLGILIGGMGTMVPERREEIVSLGLKSILAGTLATCMTGVVVGMLGF
jgi:CNT family concentrative nucleoside transporter